MVIHCKDAFNLDNDYQEYFDIFPYPLSDFQKWAIYAIINGHHSLVTAHTGSGKTLPAEFAIQFFKKQNKKVIYTAPIKALCNQKLYDLKQKFPHISFGILTGDVKDNPEADVLIMTTEILRNTLFTKKINKTNADEKDVQKQMELQFEIDMDTELGAVVFDEVHYIGDQDRGSVWEQAILLLPRQVQLIMLSATIEKPEIFADWVEREKNKDRLVDEPMRNLYMTTTYERVVPLTHYAWLTTHKSTIQTAKDTPYEQKLKDVIGKPIVLASSGGKFNDINYYKIVDVLNYFQKNKDFIKRQFVLNDLVKYLERNNMLPAICFVFSRKNVELCAKEINMSLFEKDDKTPSIIEHECEKILISKLKNYKEYIALPEYRFMIDLLKKGIAIHHAGIMPILREMVELLFEKKYIKLLFATETFAVGINMPTKTVIFSSVSKFSGEAMRELLSHEYTQMAGRAGRRGIDTIGHVIHCNNLFSIPDITAYKKMLVGSPKMLTSQFKISFNLILSILSSNSNNLCHRIDDELITFMEKSFIQNDIVKEINNYDITQKELEEKIETIKTIIADKDICVTPEDIMSKYFEIREKMEMVAHKQKKKLYKELNTLELNNTQLKVDIEKYETLRRLELDLLKNGSYKLSAVNYIQTNIDCILTILKGSNFIECNFELTTKGIVAMELQEVHSLGLADLYDKYNGFKELSAKQIAALFSCFTNISIPNDNKLQFPDCKDVVLKTMSTNLSEIINKYYDLELDNQLNTGIDYTLHYELIDYIMDWCDASDEISCKTLIIQLKEEKEIFLGEFIKAILKINNIAKEFEKICETLHNIELLQKIQQIPIITLKYVATNQSLYI
jgi:superfamily II RNA helicase